MDPIKMRERIGHCVCKMCGSKLEMRVVVFNRYGGEGLELYCPTCQRIEYGVDEKIYRLAKAFVEDYEFDYFPEMEEGKRNFQLNVAKICEVLSWNWIKMQALMESEKTETE